MAANQWGAARCVTDPNSCSWWNDDWSSWNDPSYSTQTASWWHNPSTWQHDPPPAVAASGQSWYAPPSAVVAEPDHRTWFEPPPPSAQVNGQPNSPAQVNGQPNSPNTPSPAATPEADPQIAAEDPSAVAAVIQAYYNTPPKTGTPEPSAVVDTLAPPKTDTLAPPPAAPNPTHPAPPGLGHGNAGQSSAVAAPALDRILPNTIPAAPSTARASTAHPAHCPPPTVKRPQSRGHKGNRPPSRPTKQC